MPACHALKVIDDRPFQIFVVKLLEDPFGRAVSVDWVLTLFKLLQALED